jgi:hypothetical protein
MYPNDYRVSWVSALPFHRYQRPAPAHPPGVTVGLPVTVTGLRIAVGTRITPRPPQIRTKKRRKERGHHAQLARPPPRLGPALARAQGAAEGGLQAVEEGVVAQRPAGALVAADRL